MAFQEGILTPANLLLWKMESWYLKIPGVLFATFGQDLQLKELGSFLFYEMYWWTTGQIVRLFDM